MSLKFKSGGVPQHITTHFALKLLDTSLFYTHSVVSAIFVEIFIGGIGPHPLVIIFLSGQRLASEAKDCT